MCNDCQAYAHYLGRAKEILDENGGTDVLPVPPAYLKITGGVERLQCLRLSDRGILRWYAGCCKTPIANILPSPKSPYAGVVYTIMDHAADGQTREGALGAVYARVQARWGIGDLPKDAHPRASLQVILKAIRFVLSAFLNRLHTPSPFFDSTGKPIVRPYILTTAEREDLRKFCGPNPTNNNL